MLNSLRIEVVFNRFSVMEGHLLFECKTFGWKLHLSLYNHKLFLF